MRSVGSVILILYSRYISSKNGIGCGVFIQQTDRYRKAELAQQIDVCVLKSIRKDNIQIAGHSFLWDVVCVKQVVYYPIQ